MGTATLTIDLDAIAANWRALDAMSGAGTETGAVIKADAYGLDAARVGPALASAGVRTFFVAVAEEGARLSRALGAGPRIFVFSGHMAGDTGLISENALIPLLNSPQQVARHRKALPDHAFGYQLDTGMNRLGIEPADWADLKATGDGATPALVMSHLACSDEPDHEMNRQQLAAFVEMTHGIDAPRSLAATGGTILGPAYHFDLTRPGVGLYGGLPFADAAPVVRISAPVIQTRIVQPGETVGYANSWTAERKTHLATISAGYADGLIRAMGPRAHVYSGDTACKVVGRVSMDLITVDISHLADAPDALDILGPAQGVDDVAEAAGTIGYEILTSLGARYTRRYVGGAA